MFAIPTRDPDAATLEQEVREAETFMGELQTHRASSSAPQVDAGGPRSGIIDFLVKKSIVADQSQATIVVLGFIVVALILSVGIFVWSGNSGPTKPPVPSIDGTYTH